MSDGIARFKDFTGDGGKIQFAVSGVTFTARDDIPLAYLGKLSELTKGLGDDGEGAILGLFSKLLEPESFARFEEAVNGEGPAVIGIGRIKDIIPWLLEQYGLRPTQPSSGSSNMLSESGGNLMDGPVLVDATS